MIGRRDPMPGMAEIVLGAIGNALELGPPAVTTIGRMAVEPNLSAGRPDLVRFTVDARHPDAAEQERAVRPPRGHLHGASPTRAGSTSRRASRSTSRRRRAIRRLVATFEAAAAEEGSRR